MFYTFLSPSVFDAPVYSDRAIFTGQTVDSSETRRHLSKMASALIYFRKSAHLLQYVTSRNYLGKAKINRQKIWKGLR